MRDAHKTQTDAQLIIAAQEDPEAFGFLMERYEGQLFHYVRRIGQVSHEDAQDILQEVFIKIYQKLNEYSSDLKFSSWAYRIAHNHVIDHFRKVNARPKTDTLSDDEWSRLISGSIHLEKEVSDKDCAEKVRAVIAALPIQYREVLMLRFIDDMDYEEIMDILKKPKGTVASLIARGKSLLAREMERVSPGCFT